MNDLGMRRDGFRHALRAACGEHGVTLVPMRGEFWNGLRHDLNDSVARGHGQARSRKMQIRVGAYIEPEWAYWLGMHEIGHCIYGHLRPKSMTRSEIIEQELEAWVWCIQNARYPANGFIAESADECLSSYGAAWSERDRIGHLLQQTADGQDVWHAGDYMFETGGVCF